MDIIKKYYTACPTLEKWLRQVDKGHTLVSDDLKRDKRCCELLESLIVCENAGLSLPTTFSLSQHHSQKDLVLTAIERLLKKKGIGNDVLTYGFCLMSSDQFAHSCGLAVESRYPNSCVNRLFFGAWEMLLTRIGDCIMKYLLEHTSLFLQISATCFVQLTGDPIFSLNKLPGVKDTKTETRYCNSMKETSTDEQMNTISVANKRISEAIFKSQQMTSSVGDAQNIVHKQNMDNSVQNGSKKTYVEVAENEVKLNNVNSKSVVISQVAHTSSSASSVDKNGDIKTATVPGTVETERKLNKEKSRGKRKYEQVDEEKYKKLREDSERYSKLNVESLNTEITDHSGKTVSNSQVPVLENSCTISFGHNSKKRKFDVGFPDMANEEMCNNKRQCIQSVIGEVKASKDVDVSKKCMTSANKCKNVKLDYNRRKFRTVPGKLNLKTSSVKCNQKAKRGHKRQVTSEKDRLVSVKNNNPRAVDANMNTFIPYDYHYPVPRNSSLFTRNPREKFSKTAFISTESSSPQFLLALYKDIFCDTKVFSNEHLKVAAPNIDDIVSILAETDAGDASSATVHVYNENSSICNNTSGEDMEKMNVSGDLVNNFKCSNSSSRYSHGSVRSVNRTKQVFDLSKKSEEVGHPSFFHDTGFSNISGTSTPGCCTENKRPDVMEDLVKSTEKLENNIAESDVDHNVKRTMIFKKSADEEEACCAEKLVEKPVAVENLKQKNESGSISVKAITRSASHGGEVTNLDKQSLLERRREHILQNKKQFTAHQNFTPILSTDIREGIQIHKHPIGNPDSSNLNEVSESWEDRVTMVTDKSHLSSISKDSAGICPESSAVTSTDQESSAFTSSDPQSSAFTSPDPETSARRDRDSCPTTQSPEHKNYEHLTISTDVVPLLKHFVEEHRRCPYKALLNRHCPAVNKAATSHTSRKKRAGFNSQSTVLTVKQLLNCHHSHRQVYLFIRACIVRVLPDQLIGTRKNFNILLRCISISLSQGKYDKLTLGQIMNGIKTTGIAWLSDVESNTVKLHLVARLVEWLFRNYVFVLLRTFFYVTDTAVLRYRLLYYRQTTWNKLQSIGLNGLIKRKILTPVTEEKAIKLIQLRYSLGISTLRFLPKQQSLRPIINMGSMGTAVQGQILPVNKQLASLHSVLSYLKKRKPSLIGHGKLGTDDIYLAWRAFQQQRQKCQVLPELFFVKTDITNCYDSINQNKLFVIMDEVLRKEMLDEEFIVRKYFTLGLHNGSVRKKFHREVAPMSEFNPDFISHCKQVVEKENLKNVVFVDKVVYQHETYDSLLKILKMHLCHNLIKVGSRYYHQTSGISQGSVISTLLCSFYYADMERRCIPVQEDEFLMRIVDDYLYVTHSKRNAVQFLCAMMKGMTEYNCTTNKDKVMVNFEHDWGELGYPKLAGEWFPWCGLVINTRTLEVNSDYSRYSGSCIRDTMNLELSKCPGKSLKEKIIYSSKQKCHALFTDLAVNSEHQVLYNLYQMFVLIMFKLHFYIRSLPEKQRADNNTHYFAGVLAEMVSVITKLVMKVQTYKHAVVSYDKINWLCMKACLTKLSRHHSQYRHLLKIVRRKLGYIKRKLGREDLIVLEQVTTPALPDAFLNCLC